MNYEVSYNIFFNILRKRKGVNYVRRPKLFDPKHKFETVKVVFMWIVAVQHFQRCL